LYDLATRPYSEREEEKPSDVLPQLDTMTPEELADFNASVALPNVAVGGKQPAPPKPRPRPDDLDKPKPGETPDEFRARLEELLRAQEPSDWEKAQKWFAMSEQFLDPSKTTMQSIAGAGRAFSESAAEQARAQRESELNLKKGLLEYDVAKGDEAKREAEKDIERQSSLLKAKTDVATTQISGLYRQVDQINDDLRRTIDTARQQGALDSEIANLPEVKAKSELLSDIQKRIADLQLFLDTTYGIPGMPVVDITAGTINPPRI